MRAGKPRQRGQQRAVVLEGFGHLVIETLVVLTLEPVAAEADSLGDQQAGAGGAVIVGELRAGYGDGEFRVRDSEAKRTSGSI